MQTTTKNAAPVSERKTLADWIADTAVFFLPFLLIAGGIPNPIGTVVMVITTIVLVISMTVVLRRAWQRGRADSLTKSLLYAICLALLGICIGFAVLAVMATLQA